MSDPDLRVSGGAGGTDANMEDLRTLSGFSEDLAQALASISARCHAIVVDPNVIASAVLNPGGVATFEATLLEALDGPRGLTAMSVQFETKALGLRTVAATYEQVDAAQAALMDSVLGRVVGLGIDATLVGADVYEALRTGAADDLNLERLLTDHPGLVDGVLGFGPSLVQLLPGGADFDVRSASHLLAMTYPDGNGHVDEPHEDNSPKMIQPPQGFGDLLDALNFRNDDAGEGADRIDVRRITAPDGTHSFIVDIPGTKVMNGPGFTPHSNDMGTNLHVLGGDTSARERAIGSALATAGAGPHDPVMLVGHSQGGMLAAQAAEDTAKGKFPYNVTHVVTAGSPIARADIPPNIQVLALENKHDIVPHLDARDNPDRHNITTVTFENQLSSIGENHSTAVSYLPTAKLLDTSTDPSVVAYRQSAGQFLGSPDGTAVRAQVYDISRGR